MAEKKGKIILVGSGPGDVDLITVKGLEAIRQAGVLVYDYLAPEELLSHAGEDCEKIYVGKKAGCHTMPQKEINSLIVDRAREGKVVVRRTLLLAEKGKSKEIPALPRFQITPENRLFVFYYISGADATGKPVSENRVMELHSDGSNSPPIRVPLQYPMNNYFTATVRGGSHPSKILDLLGTRVGQRGINYARVRLY